MNISFSSSCCYYFKCFLLRTLAWLNTYSTQSSPIPLKTNENIRGVRISTTLATSAYIWKASSNHAYIQLLTLTKFPIANTIEMQKLFNYAFIRLPAMYIHEFIYLYYCEYIHLIAIVCRLWKRKTKQNKNRSYRLLKQLLYIDTDRLFRVTFITLCVM